MARTVNLQQIARFAQVRRPSVSTWRRRHSDFPAPVDGTPTSPLFDSDEVAQWLDRRPSGADGTSYGERFRAGLAGSSTGAAVGKADSRVRIGLALCALAAANECPSLPNRPEDLQTAAHRLAMQDPELGQVLASVVQDSALSAIQPEIERMLSTMRPGDVAEALIREAGQGWRDVGSQTPSAVADLVLRLVRTFLGELDDLTVADLAAGAGGFLSAVVTTGVPRGLHAAEVDASAVELLRLRLRCHGRSDLHIVGDAMNPDTDLGSPPPDVIFADPPFQPGEHRHRDDHSLIWAARVAGLLEDGVGFAVVPAWTLGGSRTAGRQPVVRTREQLVRRGCVRAIIQLPRRIHPYLSGADLVLLVLASDTGARSRDVIVCDAERVREKHGDEWAQWTADLVGGAVARRDLRLCRSVPFSHLLAARSMLPRHLVTPPTTREDLLMAAVKARMSATSMFARSIDATETLAGIDLVPRPTEVAYRTIGELVRGRQLIRLPGHRIAAVDFGQTGLAVLGREEVTGEELQGARCIELTALTRYKATEITEPGDVVVLVEDQIHAFVDEDGGSVLVSPVQGLRIPGYVKHSSVYRDEPQRPWIGPYALAALLGADRNVVRGDRRTRRTGLDHLDLPLLAPADLDHLEQAARNLTDLTEQARAQAAALEATRRRVATGIAAGAFTLRMKPSTTH